MATDATGVPIVRRLRRGVALLAIIVAFALLAFDAPVGAATPPVGKRGIEVVQVEGYLDPPNISLILDSIASANERRLTLLVLQVKSSGAIDTDIDEVVRAIHRSRVPVAVWVGPSGADAKGAAAILLEAAHLAYISPGSGAGPAQPVRLDDPGATTRAGVADQLARLATRNGRNAEGARKLAGARLGSSAARAVGATNGVRVTIGELIVQLDRTKVTTAAGELKLSTAKVIGAGRDRRRQPNQEVVFTRLDLGNSLLHRLVNPSIAYFLIVAGLALIVFEFYTASVGLAGVVGALCLVGAFVGFSHLPVHWWALGLLFLSLFGFAIDVQAGGLGIWTIIATVCLVTGSWFFYGGAAQLRPAWWVFLVVIGGTLLFMLGGMTAMIRSRFSTPTVGREGMIGEDGVAEVAVDPDGVVLIRGARWRARTNRATPIQAGDPVKVVSVEGLVLEVEPPEGGAQDYRERARNRRSKTAD
jgi:membrane-bound serine protease (ClpP class)